jgi:hypothetical protein
MVISVVITPEPGGYFFIRYERGSGGVRPRPPYAHETSEAFATHEEALTHAAVLRIGGFKPLQLCYVGPYKGIPERKVPLTVVEDWT